MTKGHVCWRALLAAFPYTTPILAGFAFLGFAYGVYMNVMGFPFYYPFLLALVIFGGSLEFVAVSLLLAPFAPLATFLLALLIQARHLFYGLSLFDTYRGLGWKRFFLIYGLCDETFSIVFTAKRRLPKDVDRGWFMLWITWLNEGYWVLSALLGGLVGGMLPFDTTGLGFVMTAMFVVIFLEQWLHESCHATAMLGILAAGGSLALFGAQSFMVPAMVIILLALLLARRPLEQRYVAPFSESEAAGDGGGRQGTAVERGVMR
ncbi:AzlC family ABC transporter permease [Selenomonas bovis]|jgi:4-azaleucine resistance transporter AzlC|uniref:AzlC family ABC transporter permease n=1 Tax=Selenomonas sp. TaxID=2053611 RepID=UPI0013DC2C72|nr:AzlC family ABC transporter permease [Selenomonas sp.]